MRGNILLPLSINDILVCNQKVLSDMDFYRNLMSPKCFCL